MRPNGTADLCCENILLAFANHPEAKIFRVLGKPRTSKPLDNKDPTDDPVNETPEYVIDAPELQLSLLLEPPSVKIVGFSAAHTDSNRPAQTKSSHKALEIIFDKQWDSPSNIWALDCTTFETVVGEPLFEAQADANFHVMDILVSDMVELLGRLLETWISQLRYADSEAMGNVAANGGQLERRHQHDYLEDRDPHDLFTREVKMLGSMLRQMLSFEPEKRPGAIELFHHPFFQEPATATGARTNDSKFRTPLMRRNSRYSRKCGTV